MEFPMEWLLQGPVATTGPRLLPAAFLVVLVLAEAGISWYRGRAAYDLGETAATGVIMIGQRLIGLVAAPLILVPLFGLGAWGLFDIDMGDPLAVAALFLGVEFAYYWHHRAMHRFRLLWATHGVHHSSTRMNLTAAFRLGWGGQLTGGFLFYVPLVLIGFPPLAVLAMVALNLFYQLFLHTAWAPNLGPLERVLNTPRHHHVHHAVNDVCVDRNFGGVLIVFDRLFGTFQPVPAEDLRYGTVDGTPTRNPLKVALSGWIEMGRRLIAARSFRSGISAVFGRP